MTTSDLAHHLPGLHEHHDRLSKTSASDLFDKDPARFDRMSVCLEALVFDYSRNCLDAEAMEALIGLAEASRLEHWRAAMFRGEKINTTENRAALHTALRSRSNDPVLVEGKDIMPDVRANYHRMTEFCDAVRAGDYRPSGEQITDVVNIGIGGSDLGPRMVTEALTPFHDGPTVHYVSNVDGAQIASVLNKLNPRTTVFIIASKTFTTSETMTNARTAFAWMERGLSHNPSGHFVALSENLEATRGFGISDERTFGFQDWVGGRFSVWSAIGMSVMMAIGTDGFAAFLDGAGAADEHFRTADFGENIPVLMAMIGIWHRNVCDFRAHAILPYDNNLVHFPRWLQQLEMESNGKSVDRDGKPVRWQTSPVIFGEPGTNGQHAFYQMLHQGTDVIPADFLVSARSQTPELDHQHRLLVANCLAQSQALMSGRSLEQAGRDANRVFPGNRPSNTFLYRELDPETLGMLMAFYEHKTFVQGVIWGINSFDQWGVELGKELAIKFESALSGEDQSQADKSTTGLLGWFHRFRDD